MKQSYNGRRDKRRKTMSENANESARRKTLGLLLRLLQFALLAAALIDLRLRSEEEIRGSKKIWSTVAFISYVGPISYFIFGRKS
jgi:hypothetical protein